MTDYRGSHQPDTDADAVRFHELDRAMPDFYKRPHDYIWDMGEPEHLSLQFKGHHQAIRQAMNARGNPEARVVIYRAVPPGVTRINTGDWVTTSEAYARGHAILNDNPYDDMDVLRKQVRAKHITFGGNDGYEFGYVGEPLDAVRMRRLRPRRKK